MPPRVENRTSSGLPSREQLLKGTEEHLRLSYSRPETPHTLFHMTGALRGYAEMAQAKAQTPDNPLETKRLKDQLHQGKLFAAYHHGFQLADNGLYESITGLSSRAFTASDKLEDVEQLEQLRNLLFPDYPAQETNQVTTLLRINLDHLSFESRGDHVQMRLSPLGSAFLDLTAKINALDTLLNGAGRNGHRQQAEQNLEERYDLIASQQVNPNKDDKWKIDYGAHLKKMETLVARLIFIRGGYFDPAAIGATADILRDIGKDFFPELDAQGQIEEPVRLEQKLELVGV